MSMKELSYWGAKPFWCQPWTILLTGLIIIVFTTWWPSILWVTIFLTFVIFLWWFLFLIVAPRAYYEQNNVDSEVE